MGGLLLGRGAVVLLVVAAATAPRTEVRKRRATPCRERREEAEGGATRRGAPPVSGERGRDRGAAYVRRAPAVNRARAAHGFGAPWSG